MALPEAPQRLAEAPHLVCSAQSGASGLACCVSFYQGERQLSITPELPMTHELPHVELSHYQFGGKMSHEWNQHYNTLLPLAPESRSETRLAYA